MIESLTFKNAVATVAPSNHVIVVDISGSMYRSLPEVRKHLKENLPSLVKPEDTVSILYFSSRGDFGTVFAGRQINSATDLSEINNLIDRFLKPSGCTGFVEPLKLAAETAISLNKPGYVNNLAFMTDGYDNCWRSNEILDAAEVLPKAFDNITFIEYGWYCNRELLGLMAERSGATHVFAEGQNEYQTELENVLKSSTPKVVVDVPLVYTHAIYVENGVATVLAVQPDEEHPIGHVSIPESVSQLWVVNPDMIDQLDNLADTQAAYVLAFYGVYTMDADLVWAALKKTGDVRFIKQYSNCFTKQDYSNIKVDLTQAIVDESLRGVDGIDYNMVPAEDATTIVDVLTYLAEADVSIVTKHPLFSYKSIGRGTVQKVDDTEDKLAEEIANTTSKEERKALALKLAEHEDWTPEFNPADDKGIVPISNLVYNSERPNISVQTVQHGTVVVPEFVQKKYELPEELGTWRYRNYTIVKDGIINLKTMPITADSPIVRAKVAQDLTAMGVHVFGGPEVFIVNLESVPMVNRAMTKNISAAEFFADNVRREALKAKQKVLKFYRDELVGKGNATGLASKYGKEAADFLSANGIRDYGFSPKTSSVESTDVYMSRELNVKIKGASSLPSIASVIKKQTDGKKLNVADQLIANALAEYNAFVKSPMITSVPEETQKKLIESWIGDAAKAAINEVRALNKTLSKVVYGIVAGHGWFTDLDLEESTMDVEVDGVKYTVTAELAEKEVKI
ncbi:von Willebrand factor type A domain protein [Salmonella phage ISTP3]|nr:von Willebrand factor type A domain protein [Salmonella phage ISTP3]